MDKQLPFDVKRVQWKNKKKTLHCHYATSRKKQNQVDKALKDKWVMYDMWDPYASKKTLKQNIVDPFKVI